MFQFGNEDGPCFVDLKEVIAIEEVDNEGKPASRIYLRGGGNLLVPMPSEVVHEARIQALQFAPGHRWWNRQTQQFVR
jgi:hypothetical protein